MKLGVWDVELLAAGHSNICFFSNDGLTVRQACVILDRICKIEAEQSRASVKEPYPRNMVLVVSVGDRTVSEQILQ